LGAKLERLRSFRLLKAIFKTGSVRIAAIAHGGLIVSRERHFVIVVGQEILRAVEHVLLLTQQVRG
jgi:hypothetical protein